MIHGTIHTTTADNFIGMQLQYLAFVQGLEFELETDAAHTRIEFADTMDVRRANVLGYTLEILQRVQAWGSENVNILDKKCPCGR